MDCRLSPHGLSSVAIWIVVMSLRSCRLSSQCGAAAKLFDSHLYLLWTERWPFFHKLRIFVNTKRKGGCVKLRSATYQYLGTSGTG